MISYLLVVEQHRTQIVIHALLKCQQENLYHEQNVTYFYNDTATTEIYTFSLHDALPILRIWEDRARWVVSDLGHYLYSAVRRRAISQLRRMAVQRRAAPLLVLEEIGGAGRALPDAEFDAQGLWRRLQPVPGTPAPRPPAAV